MIADANDKSTDFTDGKVVVVGFATTGQSVARVLSERGVEIVAIDDRSDPERTRLATSLGIELFDAPSPSVTRGLVESAALVVVSPGVPPSHLVHSATDVEVISEIELAYRMFPVPLVAVTGTNGKTTVSDFVASMLRASGTRARAVGNIGVPLIEALAVGDIDIAVCEVSSFQLAYTSSFRPIVGTWLNFAEDHLDWHEDISAYERAKARIWANQQESDVAVANRDDPVVLARSLAARSRTATFGNRSGDYKIRDGFFIGPDDEKIASVSSLVRDMPHDKMNALGAIVTAREAGASVSGCTEALASTAIRPHRVELVGSFNGVSFFDDSKATTPSAVIAALNGFSSVVLISGGRNKGLRLSAVRDAVVKARSPVIRGVVAIGESSIEVREAWEHDAPVVEADTMDDAVRHCAELALSGDAVLLSPGCASFDWYSSYEERGKDFSRAVRSYIESASSAHRETN